MFREYFSIFLNMEALPGIVEGGMTMIKSKTEKMSSTEGHKKYKQAQWRSYTNPLYMKIQLEELK